jgi:hypothetical protein
MGDAPIRCGYAVASLRPLKSSALADVPLCVDTRQQQETDMKNEALNPAALRAAASGDIKNFLVASTPGGIERQEKAGQQALVASTDMPKEMSPSREAFEKVGFKFGADVDELFVKAELPPGWKRAGTEHSMHSDIVDEKGRRRVGVFYKAAFYDRRADAHLVSRYIIQRDYDLPQDDISFVVKDGGKEIFRTITTKYENYQTTERHREVATKWLLEAIPNAFEPSAWD